jgi:hypothetical protein
VGRLIDFHETSEEHSMALRFLLVSLVAGMGLELPSGQELSSWTRAGREWAGARMVELSSIRVEAERALLGSTDCERADVVAGPAEADDAGPSTADLAFDVVVEGMASTFAADLAALRADRPESIATPEAIAEQPRSEEPPMLAWRDPEPEPASVETQPDVVAEPPISPTQISPIATRVDRLSVAVRLTRQAVIAWASLIEGSSEILTDSR